MSSRRRRQVVRTRVGVAVGVLSVGLLILALFLVGTDPGPGDATGAAPAEAPVLAESGGPDASATSGSAAGSSAVAAVTQRFPGHRPRTATKELLAQVGLPAEAAPGESVVPDVDPLAGFAQAALAGSDAAVPGDLTGSAASGFAGGYPVASGAGSGSSGAGIGSGWGDAPFGAGMPGIGGGSPIASRSACMIADCGTTGGSAKPPASTTLAPLADLLAMSSTQILDPADERNNVKVEAGGSTPTPPTSGVPLPGSAALLGAGLLALAARSARTRRRR
jgi:hypothetical protein